MKIEELISTLNKAESGLGYSAYEKYDNLLQSKYKAIYGEDRLKAEIDKHYFPKQYHTCWINLIKTELINGNFNEQDYFTYTNLVESSSKRYYLILDLIKHQLNEFNNIKYAEKAIQDLPELGGENCQYRGYRLLMNHYAKKGIIDEFKKALKKANGRKSPKHEIDGAKIILLKAIYDNDGYESAKKFLANKIMKKEFLIHLMMHMSKNLTLDEVDKLIEKNSQMHEFHHNIKSCLYVESARASLKLKFDQSTFDRVFEQLETMERYTRDTYLFDLAGTTNNVNLIDKCMKLIHTPIYKKEIKEYKLKMKNAM